MQASLQAGGASPFKNIWRSYERQLKRRPVMVQMATTAVLWGSGDILAQRVAEHKPRLDMRRVFLTAAFGGSVLGPLGHWWYRHLDRMCSRFGAPGTAAFLLSKLLVDNVVFNSMNITAFFAFGSGIIDRTGPTAFIEKMRCEFLPTFAAEASVWPPYMALIFTRVPVQHQLLAVNFGTLFDVCFLSWVRNNDDALDILRSNVFGTNTHPIADGPAGGQSVATIGRSAKHRLADGRRRAKRVIRAAVSAASRSSGMHRMHMPMHATFSKAELTTESGESAFDVGHEAHDAGHGYH